MAGRDEARPRTERGHRDRHFGSGHVSVYDVERARAADLPGYPECGRCREKPNGVVGKRLFHTLRITTDNGH